MAEPVNYIGYDPNAVQPTGAPPGDGQEIHTTEDMFGGKIADAFKQAGQAIQKGASDLGSAALSRADMTNELWSNDASTTGMKGATGVWTDFNQLKGQAAVDAYPKFQAAMQKNYDDSLASAPNLQAKTMLARSMKYTTDNYLKAGASYVDEQHKQWYTDSSNRRGDELSDQAVIARKDPAVFDQYLHAGIDEMMKPLDQSGADQLERDAKARRYTGLTVNKAIESSVLDGTPDGLKGGLDLLTRYGGQMDATSRIAAEKQLAPKIKDYNANTISDFVVNHPGVPVPPDMAIKMPQISASDAQGGADETGQPSGSPQGHFRGSTAGAVSADMSDRASRLMDRLVSVHGWTPQAAAIAAGNAEQESGVRSDGKMGDPSTPGGSWGMFQWNRERLAGLKKFGGANWRDFNVQVDYFAKEAEGRMPQWKSQGDLSHAGAIGKAFEGYGDDSTGTRVANAQKWLAHYNGNPITAEMRSKWGSQAPGTITSADLPNAPGPSAPGGSPLITADVRSPSGEMTRGHQQTFQRGSLTGEQAEHLADEGVTVPPGAVSVPGSATGATEQATAAPAGGAASGASPAAANVNQAPNVTDPDATGDESAAIRGAVDATAGLSADVQRATVAAVKQKFSLQRAGNATERQSLEQSIPDLMAATTAGVQDVPWPPDDKIRQLLPAAKANRLIEERDIAARGGELVRGLRWSSSQEWDAAEHDIVSGQGVISTMMKASAKAGATGAGATGATPDSADANASYFRLQKTIGAQFLQQRQARDQALANDPASYVNQNPRVQELGAIAQKSNKPEDYEAWAQQSLGVQAYLGVPEGQQHLLQVKEAQGLASKLMAPGTDAHNTMAAMQQTYGSAWQSVFKDMVTLGKLPAAYQSVQALDDSHDAGILARAINETKPGADGKPKDWNEILGNAGGKPVKSTMDDLVRNDTSVQSFQQSLLKSGASLGQVTDITNSISTLAYAKRVYDGLDSASAAQAAVQSFTGNYEFLPGGARVPKASYDNVTAAAGQTLQAMTPDQIKVPPIYGGQGMPSKDEYMNVLKANPTWITNKTGDGLWLMDSGGKLVRTLDNKPVTIPFTAKPAPPSFDSVSPGEIAGGGAVMPSKNDNPDVPMKNASPDEGPVSGLPQEAQNFAQSSGRTDMPADTQSFVHDYMKQKGYEPDVVPPEPVVDKLKNILSNSYESKDNSQVPPFIKDDGKGGHILEYGGYLWYANPNARQWLRPLGKLREQKT